MGNRGADAPTGTSAPICLRRSIEASTASIRTSDSHPIGALRASQHGHYRRFVDQAIYILSIVTLHALFCFVLFALQLSVCLWWHDYRRDDFPTLKFGVVMADLARHLLREEPFALSAAPAIRAGEPGRC